jgi:tetratricopeptide (TPR) repeat protein
MYRGRFLLKWSIAVPNGLDRAIANFDYVIAKKPAAYQAYYARAEAYEEKGNLDHAIADYSEAIRLHPTGTAYMRRAQLWSRIGNLDGGIADYTAAAKLKPKSAGPIHQRAFVWQQKGDISHAIDDVTEAIRREPVPGYFVDRANMWVEKGDLSRAMADFDEAIRQAPELSLAYAYRARVWLKEGDKTRALADADHAVEYGGGFAITYQVRAEVLTVLDRRDDAIAAYREALKKLTNSSQKAEILAATAKLGSPTEARQN